MLAKLEHFTDERMIQRRGRPGFPAQALPHLLVGGYPRRQHFDRHAAVQARIMRQVDLPHATRAEVVQYVVRSEVRWRRHTRPVVFLG